MFYGYTPIKSFEEGLHHYQIIDDDVENNLITYFNLGFPQYKTFFPWHLASENLRKRLIKPFIINNAMVNYSHSLVCETSSLCHVRLVKSIAAIIHLTENIVDLTDTKITNLSKELIINEFTFVNAIGHKNLFFVVDVNRINNIFKCVEVHTTKHEAYRVVNLHKDQLRISQWKGEFTSFFDDLRQIQEKSQKELEEDMENEKLFLEIKKFEQNQNDKK